MTCDCMCCRDRRQSTDIQDLLNLIKELEERIIALEKSRQPVVEYQTLETDAWYWDH